MVETVKFLAFQPSQPVPKGLTWLKLHPFQPCRAFKRAARWLPYRTHGGPTWVVVKIMVPFLGP